MAKERLDKIIASAGVYSRKEVKQLIRDGRISVNGTNALHPEDKIDPETSVILVDGAPFSYSRFTYLMLHKPDGYVSATKDPNDPTVLDLLPSEYHRKELFPVGRLDKDTEGLLLITDDGAMAHELLSPKKHVEKEYFVRVAGVLTEEDVCAFQSGILLKDGYRCQSAVLTIQKTADSARSGSEATVIIKEGKYHQIKRMFAAVGKPVLYLKRLRMGPLLLDQTLEKGSFRPLTDDEIKQLQTEIKERNTK